MKNKLLLGICICLLLISPMVSAGLYTDISDWFRDIFGMDVRVSDTNYNYFNGYYVASDKEKYNCFPDLKGIVKSCQKARISVKNNNNYTDEVYMFPEFNKDVDIQKIEIGEEIIILSQPQINNITGEEIIIEDTKEIIWHNQIIYDTSDNKYNKKKTDYIKIKSGETINYRITFLPTENYEGEFNVMFNSKKEGLFGFDPYYNLSDGFSVAFTNPTGITIKNGNFYILDADDSDIYNYTKDKVFVNKMDSCNVLSTGSVFSLFSNDTIIWESGKSGIQGHVCTAYGNGSTITDYDIDPPNVAPYGIIKYNETTMYTSNSVNSIKVFNIDFAFKDSPSLTSAGVSLPKGMATNGSDIWVIDSNDNFLYHFNRTLGNLSDGIGLGEFGMSSPLGVVYDPIDKSLWITDSVDNFVYHLGTNSPPEINNITTSPKNLIYLNQSISCNFGISDLETEVTSLTYNLTWLEDGVIKSSFNKNSLGVINSEVLDLGNYTKHDVGNVWKCKVYGNDGSDNGFINETETTIITLLNNITENYEGRVVETEATNFSINITLLEGSLIQANFIYNGTNYSVLQSTKENSYTFSKIIYAPLVDNEINNTFYWNIQTTYEDYNSSKHNHTINDVTLSIDCNLPNVPAINFTFADEINQTNITVDYEATFDVWISKQNENSTFTFDLTGVNSTQLCIGQNDTFYTDAMIEYKAEGYDYRDYYLVNATLNNNTQYITLYSLELALASGIKFIITDENDNKEEGIYIKVLRYFVGTNTYKTVAMGKTDDNGEEYLYLRKFDAWYKFVLERGGGTLYTSTARKITTDEITIKLSPDTIKATLSKFDILGCVIEDVNNSNNEHTITAIFSDPSGYSSNMCLSVLRRSTKGDKFICNECITTTSGTIACQTGNTTGSYISSCYANINPDNILETYVFDIIEDNSQIFGLDGVLGALLIVGTVSMIGLASPPIAIVLAIFGLIVVSALKLFWLSTGALIAIIIVGVIYIIKLRS